MKKSTSKFRDQVAGNSHRQKTQGSQYGYLGLPRGVNIYNEKPGSRAQLDVVPYAVTDDKHPDRNPDTGAAMPGELWYKRPFKLHRNIGVNNESAVCPTSVTRPCPVCNHRSTLRKDPSSDQDMIKALRPSDRNLYVVVPREDKEYEEKPHIWDISQFCFQDALNDEIEENDDHAVFPSPEEGLTLKIRFSEEVFAKNKFAKTSRIDFEPRRQPISEEILKAVPNLDEVLIVLSYKELENKFLEIDQEQATDQVEEEEEDKSKRPVAKDEDENESQPPAPKRRPVVVEDDEKAVETPRRSPKKSSDEEAKTVCVACDGTGENSRGKPCPICRGTGKRLSVPTPTPSSPPPIAAKTKQHDEESGNGKCPYKHRFGVDCEAFNECDDCEIWDACFEAKEARK